jgi:hypothetical protein
MRTTLLAAAAIVVAASPALAQETPCASPRKTLITAGTPVPRQYPRPAGLPILVGSDGLLRNPEVTEAAASVAGHTASIMTVIPARRRPVQPRSPSCQLHPEYEAEAHQVASCNDGAWGDACDGYQWVDGRCDVMYDFHHQDASREVIIDFKLWAAQQTDDEGFWKYDSPAADCPQWLNFVRPHGPGEEATGRTFVKVHWTVGRRHGDSTAYVGADCETCENILVRMPCVAFHPFSYVTEWHR